MAAPVVPSEIGSVPPEYTPSAVPHDRLAGVWAGHARLGDLVARLDDESVARPTLLPGWTIGHLLTHLARNADSHTEMVTAAGLGGPAAQYPGGAAQRDGGIAAGAGRSAELLAADLTAAHRRLEQAWDTVHVGTWRTGYGLTARLGPVTLADLVFLRWREVEIHAVDLGLTDHGGPDWGDLSPAYVDAEWRWSVARLNSRLAAGSSVLLAPGDRTSTVVRAATDRDLTTDGSDGSVDQELVDPELTATAALSYVEAPTALILRWLAGRGGEPGWPQLSPWT